MPAPRPDLIALDLGGANIKAADGHGWTHTEPFPLWREPTRLVEALTRLLVPLSPHRVVATMTGEIADCYPSRADGVADITAAVAVAAARAGSPLPIGIYTVTGRIVTAADVLADPAAAAAANWHAAARLAAGLVPQGPGLLVDVGSTTTDIVPLLDGRVAPLSTTDAGRLLSGELVYTGVERTPLATLVRRLPHAGRLRPVVAERFADSRDAWVVLGELAEDPDSTDTADGRPVTRDAARRRLARALLLDHDDVSATDAVALAEELAAAQTRLVARAIRRVVRGCGVAPQVVVVSGHGPALALRGLARARLDPRIECLHERLGAAVSRCAPAHALAIFARGPSA